MSTELQQFNEVKAEITTLVAPVLQVKVVDFKSSLGAIEAAKTLKAMANRLDDLRRAEVDPLNAKVKSINEYVRQIKAPLDAADVYIRNELNRFAAEQEKFRQEELRKAEEERIRKENELRIKQEEERKSVEEGMQIFGADYGEAKELEKKQEIERAQVAVEIKQKEWDINQGQLKNTRKTTKVRVIDLTKVPREFLIIEVNERAAIAAHKAGVQIAGLEFYQEIGLAIGQKTRVTRMALEGEAHG